MTDGFFFPPGTPEEVIEHIKAQHALQEMSRTDYHNRVRELLDTLNPDQLVTLREMFHTTSIDESAAPYLQGNISAILIYKHKVCVSCGSIDHMIHGEGMEIRMPEAAAESNEQLELPFESSDDSERAANMELYNVREPHEAEVLASPDEDPVICLGCGMLYQSLNDRMLRKPGIPGCEGCIQKQKWG